jgi:cytidine deaminase
MEDKLLLCILKAVFLLCSAFLSKLWIMKTRTFETTVQIFALEELTSEDRELCQAALKAADDAYAIYSNFHVGAAVMMENGEIITGNNQENAAYPSGLCAERVALFSASARFPHVPILTLAIAAKKDDKQTDIISPCGSCRQVLIETEKRFGKPIRVLLFGMNEILEFPSAESLLPFSFFKENLM